MRKWRELILVATAMTVASCAGETPAPTPPAPAAAPVAERIDRRIVLTDAAGARHEPLAVPAGSPGAVLLFVALECPISNGYAPEMNRIVEAYGAKGYAFYFVHGDPDVTPAQAAQHAADFGYRRPVLLDPAHALVRAAGATVTPQAAVVSPTGEVRYLGRIDDLYVSFGKRRHEPTVRELRDALDAVLAGTPAPPAQGRAIGCTIPAPRAS